MTGFFSGNKPKLLHDLNDTHLNKALQMELLDHRTALTDKRLDQDTFISENGGEIQYFNRYLNTAVYDSLIRSGTFLNLKPRLQLDLANLYSRLCHRNNLIDSKLRAFGYELEMKKAQGSDNTTKPNFGGTGESNLRGVGISDTSSSTKIISQNVIEVQPNAGLEANIYNTKKEIMDYDKDILERVEDLIDYLSGDKEEMDE